MHRYDEILKSALKLPERERAQVVRELLESFDGEASADTERAWAEEVAQRIRELINGTAETQPADQAIEQARAKIKRRK